MRTAWLATILAACSGGAAKPAGPIDNKGGASTTNESFPKDVVVIRACNDTTYDFATFQYYDYEGPVTSVPAGACTAWHTVPKSERAYGYTYAKFTIAGAELIIQPIDYMGETPLAPGRWSYGITIIDLKQKRADIKARREAD